MNEGASEKVKKRDNCQRHTLIVNAIILELLEPTPLAKWCLERRSLIVVPNHFTKWNGKYLLIETLRHIYQTPTSIRGTSFKNDKHIYTKKRVDEPNLFLERDKSVSSTPPPRLFAKAYDE